MDGDFFIFHTGNFLPFDTKNLQNQGKFRPEATRNLCYTFAALTVLLQVSLTKVSSIVQCISSHIWALSQWPIIKIHCINISAIGVAKIFDWGRKQNANHMLWWHQIVSKGGIFMGQRYRRMFRSVGLCVWHITMILLKGETFNQKLQSFPKISKLGEVVSWQFNKKCRIRGFGGRVPSRTRLWVYGGKAPSPWAILCNTLEKIALLILMPFGSHFARF